MISSFHSLRLYKLGTPVKRLGHVQIIRLVMIVDNDCGRANPGREERNKHRRQENV